MPFSVKEGFFGGAVYGGKSDVLLMYPIVHGWIKKPKFAGLFLRRTMPELRNEIIPRSKQYYPRWGGVFNKSDSVWNFPSGARILFGHCENEDDVHDYDSFQGNYVAFDELTSFTQWQYLYITIERTRRGTKYDTDLPMVVRSASNPGNIGHTWVKKRFIDPCITGNVIVVGKGGIKRIFIPATIDDNPHADEQYKRELDALPEAERQAKKYGNWSAYEGQVFEEFREKHYPDEPPNALHVMSNLEIPDWWPKIVVGDWGYRAMTWIGFGAISPTERVYVYRELAFQKTKIKEWGAILNEFLIKENPRQVLFCRSAGQDRGQEHTIQQQIEEAIGRPIGLSNNSAGSRVAGKLLLHEYLRWKPKYLPAFETKTYNPEHAQWLIRNRGMKDYESYLRSFEPPKPEENIPRLIISDECPLLINAIKSATYAKPKNNVPAEDVAEWDGDDPYDGIRYLCDAADRYFVEAKVEMEKLRKQENLISQLNSTQDFTAFYRNAKRLESENTIKPLMRYHGHH